MTYPASVWEKLGDLIKDLISKAVINSLNVNDLGTSSAEPPYQYFIGLPCRIKLFNHKGEVGFFLAKSAFTNLQSAARLQQTQLLGLSSKYHQFQEPLVLQQLNSRLDFTVTSTSICHCTNLFFPLSPVYIYFIAFCLSVGLNESHFVKQCYPINNLLDRLLLYRPTKVQHFWQEAWNAPNNWVATVAEQEDIETYNCKWGYAAKTATRRSAMMPSECASGVRANRILCVPRSK